MFCFYHNCMTDAAVSLYSSSQIHQRAAHKIFWRERDQVWFLIACHWCGDSKRRDILEMTSSLWESLYFILNNIIFTCDTMSLIVNTYKKHVKHEETYCDNIGLVIEIINIIINVKFVKMYLNKNPSGFIFSLQPKRKPLNKNLKKKLNQV